MRDQSVYKKLIVWQLAKELRSKIYQATKTFRNQEFKRVNQTNDAARSFKQNIQEGYKRGSTNQFIQSLYIAAGSLAEVRGDIEDYFEDELINQPLSL